MTAGDGPEHSKKMRKAASDLMESPVGIFLEKKAELEESGRRRSDKILLENILSENRRMDDGEYYMKNRCDKLEAVAVVRSKSAKGRTVVAFPDLQLLLSLYPLWGQLQGR